MTSATSCSMEAAFDEWERDRTADRPQPWPPLPAPETAALDADAVALAVHDLKSPLSTVKANVEFMQEQAGLSVDCRDALRDMADAVAAMQRLVADMLEARRAGAPVMCARVVRTDVGRILDDVVRATRLRGMARGQRIETRTRLGCNPVCVDPHLIRRVIENLVDNAIKHAGPGRITIEAESGEDRVELRVSDEGPGIRPDVRERIFDAGTSGAAGEDGADSHGLGLHLCRRVVALHGGRIWVEDHEPRGSTFRIELPLRGVRLVSPSV